MIPSTALLCKQLGQTIESKSRQGHVVEGLEEELRALEQSPSYEGIITFARRLANLPLRDDWPFVEPSDLEGIWAECDPARATKPIATVDPAAIAPRVEGAFLSSLCGCVLGKPIEGKLDLAQIRSAAEKVGAWPLDDYIPEAMLEPLGYRHPDWGITVRERIRFVAPDDDINYTVVGMLLLEKHGLSLNRRHIADAWIKNLPVFWCWGPERVLGICAALWSVDHGPEFPFAEGEVPFDEWQTLFNPMEELCGALIRADAFGYACPGHPALAAELAWRDASFSHRRTGIYGEMFAAAAIATAFVADEPMAIFRTALQYVPQRSRFARVVRDCLEIVQGARDWLEAYERIHGRYLEHGSCRIYQEIGTVMNALHFAGDVGEGICMQVAQGNDTDSFGCTCGSILGAFHGPEGLDGRWLAPFNDTIHTTVATLHEMRVSALAARMGRLPARVQGPGFRV